VSRIGGISRLETSPRVSRVYELWPGLFSWLTVSHTMSDVGESPITASLAALPFGGEPLPRRHSLSREDVIESQRGRIQHAVFSAVAAKGYTNTTIADIVERAAVSRQTFYQHFASKEECFKAAYDAGGVLVREHMGPAVEPALHGPWRDLVRIAFDSYLDLLASEPEASWAMLVEVFCAGPAFVGRGADYKRAFADLFRVMHYVAREQEPELPELSSGVFDVLVGGIIDRVRDCLYHQGAAELRTLEPMLSEAVFTVFGAPSAQANGKRPMQVVANG